MISINARHHFPAKLLLVLCTLVAVTYARSWDLAVVIGNEIDFFARNQSLTGQANIGDAVALTGITYDDTTRTMYLSDTKNNMSIFSNDLTKRNLTSTPLLKKENGTYIIGIVFDTLSRTLFWAEALKGNIMKMHVSMTNETSDPVLLHDLTGKSPRGITLDVCNRHIYWANSNSARPTIERSNLDGSGRITVIKENLYEPVAVAVDHAEQKIYWIDDVEGINFKIERSNLDGSNRELLVHNRHQQPVYLAVDSESIYWSDWVYSAIWVMPKNSKPGDIPVEFKSYYGSKRDADPAGIVTRDNIGNIDCLAIQRRMEKRANLSTFVPDMIETFNNLTTSTELSDLTTENFRCLNNGQLNKMNDTCYCKPGFSGPLCEISLCYNYCLRGKCHVNHHGLPECECVDMFSGTRCERPDICAIYCASGRTELSDIGVTTCRCADTQEVEGITLNGNFHSDGSTLLPIFITLTALLLFMIIGLSCYVNQLRSRPRIKKRFVVSKGVTPLTSRPQIPNDQCEITIENCCNMNICETPCFEPNLRNGVPRSNNMKKEEKNSLLDNMEDNSC